jgi:membrane protein required for colicin V production
MSAASHGWVDWALLALLALSIVVGLWRGLVFEVLSLLGWIAAYVAAQAFAPEVAVHVPVGTPGSAINLAVTFAALFLLALIAWALASRLLRLLIHATPLQLIDRALGGGFGLLRGAVLLLVVASVVSLTPASRSPAWQQSQGATWLVAGLQTLKPVLPETFAQRLP